MNNAVISLSTGETGVKVAAIFALRTREVVAKLGDF